MKKILLSKLKEAFISVFPITTIVIIISLTSLVNLSMLEITVFTVSSVFLILGISFFNLGADLAMTPMGEYFGAGLTKTKKINILLSVCFFMGVLITLAEPDLSVLASQVESVINGTLLIVTISIGVGLFLLLAVIKIIFKHNLSILITFFYMTLFAIVALLIETGKSNFLALSFDSGGVTTGPITVPFLMALGVGIASTIGGADANENSFGLVALCSIGPIIAVMFLAMFSKGELTYSLSDYSVENQLGNNFWNTLFSVTTEVVKALSLIVIFFLVLQLVVLKLPKKRLYKIATGIIYTLIGLVLFLTAVTVGFMPIGFKIGKELAEKNEIYLIIFGFILGAVVVLAEPAVHVLNKQVEEITGGSVSKKSMIIALSVGVGLSIVLSLIRIIFKFSILYYILPGYITSLGLSFFVPKIYTAIAFDSGGVASGPLTSTFILPMSIGVCTVLLGESEVLNFAFGVVSMVAMTPLITIQLLGFKAITSAKVRENIVIRRILSKEDEQIIYFN